MGNLDKDIRYLKGVGETRAKSLAKLGILNLRDLLNHFPRNYEDRSQLCQIAYAMEDQPVTIKAFIANEPTLSRIRRGMELVKFRAVDDTGSVDITFFNQSWLKDRFHRGDCFLFYGKIIIMGSRLSMSNPAFEPVDPESESVGSIVPIYSLTKGISGKMLSIIPIINQAFHPPASVFYRFFTPPRRTNMHAAPSKPRTPRDMELADKFLPINLIKNANFVLHSRRFVL